MATTLEELQLYHKAVGAAAALSALIARPSFRLDQRLRDRLASTAERVTFHIGEGLAQSTDQNFSQYCHRARRSSSELRAQLVVAVQRKHITASERLPVDNQYEEIERMLTRLIGRLEAEDRKERR